MRKLGAILAMFTLVFTGCATSAPAPDEAVLSYASGPTRSIEFKDCVEPNTRNYSFPTHKYFTYPRGQRTWDFSSGNNADSAPFQVVTSDPVSMRAEGVATYTLNTDCETLQKFHERIGIKFDAWTEDGWLEMLDVYVKQPLNKALDAASKQYSYIDLYTDADKKNEWENVVQELTAREVSALGGAEFFQGFSLTLQAPVPSEEIRLSLENEQKAVADNRAQKQRNATVRTELESIRELVEVLGPEGYVLYKAIQDDQVTVVPVPSGTGLNLNQ